MSVCTLPQFGISPRSADRPTASQFLANTGSLALQVSGPGRPSRLVRLRAPKCTVGSAAGCTLRLRADGIDSLHCWILRGEAGTVIRRLNGVAALNGAHFDEALLAVGDRVSIGSVEMVVVECNTALPITQIPVEATTRYDSEVQSLQTTLDAALQQIERLEVESRQGFKSSIMAAERADQLRDALAETNQQLEEVCGELTAAQDTIAAQTAELEAQTAKLSSFNSDDQSAREKIERLESQAAAAAAKCESLTSQLNEFQAAQTAERENWTTERTQLAQRCEELTAQLQSVGGELSARSEAATIVFEKHTLAGAVADAKLNEFTEQLAEKHSEIQALKHLLDGQTIIASRLEQLTCDYQQKCQELTELQGHCDELSSRSVAAQEIEQKAQSLEHLQTELTNREASLADATRVVEDEKTNLAAKSQQLEATRDDLVQEQQRLADLRRELEQSQAGFSDLDQRRAELDQRNAQLESQSAEIEAHAASVACRASELDSRQSQIDARTSEVESRAKELESRANQLETRATELEYQAAELASKATAEQSQAPILTMPFAALESQSAENEAKAAELDSRAAEINTRVGELQQLLEQLVDQRATFASREQELCDRQNACESRLEEINHQAVQLAALRDELRARSEQLAEQEARANCQVSESAPQYETPAPSNDFHRLEPSYAEEAVPNPTNLGTENPSSPSIIAEYTPAPESNDEAEMNSVLSRLVQAGMWKQTEGESAEAPAVAESTEAAVASDPLAIAEEPPPNSTMMFEAPALQRPQMKQASGGGDEESIESYMNRLMKRVRGDGAVGDSSWKSSSIGESPAPTPAAEPLTNSEPVPALSDSQAAEYSPRRTAPELTTNLSAMRDLANSAARTAIDQHVRQHSSRRATKKLFGACVTVGFSLVMAYWAWRIHSFQAALGAGLGGAIGGYWTMAALRRLSGLKRLDRETEKSAAMSAGIPVIPAIPELPPQPPTNV